MLLYIMWIYNAIGETNRCYGCHGYDTEDAQNGQNGDVEIRAVPDRSDPNQATTVPQ